MRLEPVALDTCNSGSDSLCLEPSFLARCVTAGSSEATACAWRGGALSKGMGRSGGYYTDPVDGDQVGK